MKKIKNLYQTDGFQLYGLKWEFMRRNPQYVADYHKYFDQVGRLKYPPARKEATVFFVTTYQIFNPLKPDLSFFEALDELYLPEKVARRMKHWNNLLRMEEENKADTKKYELEKARFDDSIKDILEFEGIYDQVKFWACGVYRIDGREGRPGSAFSAEDVEAVLKQGSGGKSKSLIKILVDGSAPVSNIVEALKDELWWERLHRIRSKPVEVRNRIDKLKKYLEVYTLREETHWSFDRIAKKLYPKEHDEALGLKDPKVQIESLVKRVNEHYLQAKWYIDGGFREIR